MPTSHCKKCGPHKKCSKFHVYVVQLRKDVLLSKRFLSQNSHVDPRKVRECFYVGETSHKPYCRFRQHQGWYKGDDSYDCRCEAKKITRPFRESGRRGRTKGSWCAGKYGIELRPDLYGSLNPIFSLGEARMTEKDLAEKLRDQGYAVWQN